MLTIDVSTMKVDVRMCSTVDVRVRSKVDVSMLTVDVSTLKVEMLLKMF